LTESELRDKFTVAYKIIARERKMREHVFRHDPVLRSKKLAEMDELLALVVELKDFCKEHVEPSFEQPVLLDVPGKVEYPSITTGDKSP
jgi:hypothetical protein